MTKKTKAKRAKTPRPADADNTGGIQRKKAPSRRKGKMPESLKATAFKKGQSGNPAGRPKGSRNKFAEQFLADYLEDWELNGKDALKRCRERDPAAYVRVAATLLPKDFNVNFKGDEAQLEKFLEQFTDDQLQDLVAGLATVGASGKKDPVTPQPRNKPDSVH